MNTAVHTPVVYDTDISIIGGNLAAISAALSLKELGHRVLMVVRETYMLEDLCLPHFVNSEKVAQYFGRTFDNPDQLKRHAEKELKSCGIDFVYGAAPLDVYEINEQKLFRIAGKFGICGIRCQEVLDLRRKDAFRDRMIIDALNGPDITAEDKFTVRDNTFEGYEVTVRRGSCGNGHVLFILPLSPGDCPEEKALRTFRYAKGNLAAYKDLELCRFSGGAYASTYDAEVQIVRGQHAAAQPDGVVYHHNPGYTALDDGLELAAENPQLDYDVLDLYPGNLPAIHKVIHTDAVVAGGGTAGAMAALFLARQGIKTVLIELNGRLGGTSTIGGVSTYWFGKRHRETVELDARIQAHYDSLGISRKPGIWSPYDDFNPDLKAFTLKQMCDEAGVEILFNAVCYAALRKKNEPEKVNGVVLTDGSESIAILARYVIDTTGDGDIAAFAGADFHYGSERDAIAFWASLAQYPTPNAYKNNFSTTVMVSHPGDYTRFILGGRQRGDNLYDHGAYVAPRESRHIRGVYKVTLKDIVTFKTYPDTVYTCFSNYDPKGKLDADMVYCGFLPPQNSAAVPLRALLPMGRNKRRIYGLLVGGKAFSCTHNAFPGLRMQPDLQHQGAVLGIIAAEAIKDGVEASQLDIGALQQKIRGLTGDALNLESGKSWTPEDLVDAINGNMRLEWTDFPFEDEVRELPASMVLLTVPSQDILPLLESRFSEETDASVKLILARFILWHGSDFATEYLMESIKSDLDGASELPERKGSLKCVQLLPDHGIMAETVNKLNLLAWSHREDIHIPFERVLHKLTKITRDYHDNKRSIYHYIETFAYVAERRCLKTFIPMLKDLLDLPELAGLDGENTDILMERLKILKLSLLRALARCGDTAGFMGLTDLLEDPCAAVSISACMELRALTGRKWGRDSLLWRDFIMSGKFTPHPKPIRKKIW